MESKNCRYCHCWDGQACPGGCHWVLDDICSKCTGNRKPTIDDLQKRGFKNKDYIMSLGRIEYHRRTFTFSIEGTIKKMTLIELDKYLDSNDQE